MATKAPGMNVSRSDEASFPTFVVKSMRSDYCWLCLAWADHVCGGIYSLDHTARPEDRLGMAPPRPHGLRVVVSVWLPRKARFMIMSSSGSIFFCPASLGPLYLEGPKQQAVLKLIEKEGAFSPSSLSHHVAQQLCRH